MFFPLLLLFFDVTTEPGNTRYHAFFSSFFPHQLFSCVFFFLRLFFFPHLPYPKFLKKNAPKLEPHLPGSPEICCSPRAVRSRTLFPTFFRAPKGRKKAWKFFVASNHFGFPPIPPLPGVIRPRQLLFLTFLLWTFLLGVEESLFWCGSLPFFSGTLGPRLTWHGNRTAPAISLAPPASH